MKIILVATDAKGKNVVFVSDTLRAYSLEEAVQLARGGKFENVYTVKGKNGTYLRTRKNIPAKEQLEQLSVSSRQLFAFANDTRSAASTPALARYVQLYEYMLQKDGGPLIITSDQKGKITKEAAKQKLQPHKEIIFDAAQQFNIDPYLLGAILIDEIAQFGLFEKITDPLFGYFISSNASVGIAQVKIDTARAIIRKGYYTPDKTNPKLSPEKIYQTSRRTLYEYLIQPTHSIHFAAAHIRAIIDAWRAFVDLHKKPEILATLYSLGKEPHAHPQPNERGVQIASEFYQIAQQWLQ